MKLTFFWRALAYCGVVVFIAVYGWYRLAPSVVVDNQSGLLLQQVIVELPRNRLVFDNIAAGETAKIYHSANQADGRYNYVIVAADGQRQVGYCGYLTSNMYGWKMTLKVVARLETSCQFPHLSEATGN